MFKKLLFTGFCLAAANPVHAQANLMEVMRSDLRADAQKIVAVAMALPSADAEKFWPIYREYELKRSELGDRRVALIKRYAEQYKTITEEQAKALAKDWFGWQDQRLALWRTYHEKIAKALSESVAARFIQVEYQLNLVFDLEIAREIPLVFKVGS
jgi:epoxyqueuosine reductase QueG